MSQMKIPQLTPEEQAKVLEYAYSISECLYEGDKLYIYATELKQIYRIAYIREHNIKLSN